MTKHDSEKADVRQRLLEVAAPLFTALPYHKVSTRMIAERAQSNIGMIHYYFGNKAGLFEAICKQFIDKMAEQMEQFASDASVEGLGDIIATYYQTMAPLPAFPKLIQRAMSSPEDDPTRQIIQRLFEQVHGTFDKKISEAIPKANLREGLDPELVRLTVISLMVFPFLIPPAMLQIQGLTLNEQFLERLAKHNKDLITHGFSETTSA
ncbi:TetR/AcrR family transcriptional regulator [Corallincola platygyrae]|uniref:TetR/AcrR family transcriptional regulator n=1 Tax=Corallincola platygyrae TaxID=1193278 RepID=A0ABW4XQW5_9GAMM